MGKVRGVTRTTLGEREAAVLRMRIAEEAAAPRWCLRPTRPTSGLNAQAHAAYDAVCAQLSRPLVGLVGRKCQGQPCCTPELSVVGHVEISIGWGPAEWLSGLAVAHMMPTKGRGSSAQPSSR